MRLFELNIDPVQVCSEVLWNPRRLLGDMFVMADSKETARRFYRYFHATFYLWDAGVIGGVLKARKIDLFAPTEADVYEGVALLAKQFRFIKPGFYSGDDWAGKQRDVLKEDADKIGSDSVVANDTVPAKKKVGTLRPISGNFSNEFDLTI